MKVFDDVGGMFPLPDNISVTDDKLVINCKDKMLIMIDLDVINQVIGKVNNDSKRISQTNLLDRPAD